MESSTKANGFRENVKDSVFKSGQTAVNTSDNGKTTKQTVKAPCTTLMVTSTKVSGQTTKHVVKEPTRMKTGRNT